MSLFDYQEDAIAHLKEWKVGALFMEAGTGKTRVALELANSVEDVDYILWVGPLSTIRKVDGTSVIDEIRKWGGFRNCDNIMYCGVESISQSDRIFLNILDSVKSHHNSFIIVDESLKIKNADAKRTKRLMELGNCAKYKLILNGTPMTKNILDMWAQITFLSPKILNMTLVQYKNTFCNYTTITKNRARGTHSIELMVNIVGELKKAGMSDAWIMKEIGMDADELLRLKQVSGLADLFRDKEFTTI